MYYLLLAFHFRALQPRTTRDSYLVFWLPKYWYDVFGFHHRITMTNHRQETLRAWNPTEFCS